MTAEHKPDEIDLVDELVAEARGAGVAMPDDMPSWMAKTIVGIDKLSLFSGKTVGWLLVPIFIAMVYEIVARKFFVAPTIWAYDVSRMFYGALFMLGSAYALMRGIHIRADFLYRNFGARWQGRVDFFLYVTLFIPSMLVFFYFSTEYAFEAWERMERIDDTPWQPLAAPIRTVMPVSALLLLTQGVSETLKAWYAMTKGRWPDEQ